LFLKEDLSWNADAGIRRKIEEGADGSKN